jgi:hypothetical protein
VLDDYANAAQAVAHEAERQNRRLDKAGMQATILARYEALVAARTGAVPLPPPLAPPPLGFAGQFARWIETES